MIPAQLLAPPACPRCKLSAEAVVGDSLDCRRQCHDVGSIGGDPRPGSVPVADAGDEQSVHPVDHDLVHGWIVVGQDREPERRRLEQVQPEPLPAARRQADVGRGEHAQVFVGGQIRGDQLDPIVTPAEARAAPDHPLDLLGLPVDLRLEAEPEARVGGRPEGLDRLGERLALRHEPTRKQAGDNSDRILRFASGPVGSLANCGGAWITATSSGFALRGCRTICAAFRLRVA